MPPRPGPDASTGEFQSIHGMLPDTLYGLNAWLGVLQSQMIAIPKVRVRYLLPFLPYPLSDFAKLERQ